MPSPTQWTFGPFRLDTANACLWQGEQRLALRPKAFAVLTYLVTHAGQLVTKEALFDAVWPGVAVSDTVLKACIVQMRRVLGDTVETPQCIATVHGRGYRFIAPVTVVEQPATTPVAAAGPQAALPSLRWQSVSPSPPVSSPLLVEREAVLRQLHAWLVEAMQGRRRVVLVTGEAGMGKTAVVTAFTAQAVAQQAVRLAWGQCVEHCSAGEAYLPVFTALGQLCRGPDGPHVVALLRQQAPTWLVHMPWLVRPTDRALLQHELHGATRDRMVRELAELLDTLTAAMPLVLILEDLHWSDHATLDMLAILARRREPARFLLLGTYRPVDAMGPAHPLRSVAQDLRMHAYSAELPLDPLSAPAVEAYLTARLAGSRLPAALAQRLHSRTGGHPLFLVHVVEHLMAQGVLVEQEGRWELCGPVTAVESAVPDSLRQMMAQQFERLTEEEQRVIEAGSVGGVEFTVAMVAAGLEADVGQIDACCAALVRRGQVLRSAGALAWPDGTFTTRYAFRHALDQQVAYERLSIAQQVRLHQRMGARLEGGYADRVAEVATELAMHFERGRDDARAVHYLHQAAETALQRHAPQEAQRALRRALELLPQLPDTPARTHQELTLHLTLGPALMATRGQANPEVQQVYAHAYALCQQVGDIAALFPALHGLWLSLLVQGKFPAAQDVAAQCLRLTQQHHDPAYRLVAHRAMGSTLFYRGEFLLAQPHLQQGRALYDAPGGHTPVGRYFFNPGLLCAIFRVLSLWLLGYPAQARQQLQETLTLAQALAHPATLVLILNYAAKCQRFYRDEPAIQALNQAALQVATKQEFALWLAEGEAIRGWAGIAQGAGESGCAQVHHSVATMRSAGGLLW